MQYAHIYCRKLRAPFIHMCKTIRINMYFVYIRSFVGIALLQQWTVAAVHLLLPLELFDFARESV